MTTSPSSEQVEYYNNLTRIMLKTRASRFNAAISLGFQERFSIFTTAFLSVFVLAWSVWLVATPEAFSAGDVQILGALSIIASVSILILTLLDYTQGRSLKAEKLQQNALGISLLMREMERELCSPLCNAAKLADLAERYEKGIAETQINHETRHFKKWESDSAKPEKLHQRLWHFFSKPAFSIWYFLEPLLVHVAVIGLVSASLIWFLWSR